MTEESDKKEIPLTIDDFYNKIQEFSIIWNKTQVLRFISSRSTSENLHVIEMLCLDIKNTCESFFAPFEGNLKLKTELKINAFKYLICNTNFASQSLLADDTAHSHLIDIQPPFSPYLLIEILWSISFEDVLAESILYLPLDLSVEIIEILPRCLNLLDFQKGSKFLSTIILNIYKKFIIIKNIGTQSENIVENCKNLTGYSQEVILQFTNERFLEFENITQVQQYKRYGILLKIILNMVKLCFINKYKTFEFEFEKEKMYKLTFGWRPLEKLEETVFEEIISEIDRDLTALLLKKVKEIDCNIYLNWTEYNDEEKIFLTLQRSIGLDCHFFIEDLKDFNYLNIPEFSHLIECLSQLASKPDEKDNIDDMQPEDLLRGAIEGNTNCLVSLFERYNEWDISLLTKDICLDLIEHFAEKLDNVQEQLITEKLQTSLLTFIKAIVHLTIIELYEVTIKCILQFSENEKINNMIDIESFEKFIIHNPYFSNTKNLKVILFFLCLSVKPTMKILLKMATEHSDYPDVAICLDDMMLLLPISQIRTLSRFDEIMEDLTKAFLENEKESEMFYDKWCTVRKQEKSVDDKPITVALVLQVYQEICLENPSWKLNKFSNFLSMLYSFCSISEVVKEILIPLLLSSQNSIICLKCTLVELHKLIDNHDFSTTIDLAITLEILAVYLLNSNNISKYTVNELINLINDLKKCFSKFYENKELVYSRYYMIFLGLTNRVSDELNLLELIGAFLNFYRNKLININEDYINFDREHVLRYLFLKCTKERYIKYTDEIMTYGKCFGWSNISENCDGVIRLTFETCLLCLEFPIISCLSSVSFLIDCLILFLERVENSNNTKLFDQMLCKSLSNHVTIFEKSIQCTVIAETYTKLLEEWENSTDFETYLNALKTFSLSCTKKSGNLKSFSGQHSPIAIKFRLAHNIIHSVINDSDLLEYEKLINELGEYLQ